MRKCKLVVALGLTVLTLASVTGCACQKNVTSNTIQPTTEQTANADMVSKFNDTFKDYTVQDLATAMPSMKTALANATGSTMLVASDNANVNKSSKLYILIDASTVEGVYDSMAGADAMNASYKTSQAEIDGNQVTWYKVSSGAQTMYACAVSYPSGIVVGADTDENAIVNNMSKLGIRVK